MTYAGSYASTQAGAYAGAHDVVLAHHPLLTALPFVVPAFIVVGLIGAIVWRDRREDRAER